ncbi:MAG: hypothetical protein IMF26_02765 [Candidatus Fermentithermobacillus carboniphilus]|uniref:Uncharacterized protein n=1 Tax=Candidatus Fermentithermobacillus carboniphilus TaxID=3085328 RepID=A0AAT9LFL0_9FIRM|nr:MAG: hypothetical protein IMF26_02765 [Candidatus Fermentithermobacillus carboniphilus]
MTTAITWAGAICTIAIYSFLWKENRLFRAFQNLYVGLAAGYGIILAVRIVQRQVWNPLTTKGDYSVLIPTILGILLYARFSKKWAWVARLPMAFLMGIGAALSMKAIESDFVRQIQATLIPWNSFNNIIVVFGTILSLSYFFFTLKPRPALDNMARVGRWVLMVSFGAAFGNAVQGRLSLLIAQMQFMLRDWLHLIK